MYSNFKKAITPDIHSRAMEIRIVLDDDGPGPASNGDAAVVTSLKTKPEDGEGSGKEDPEQTKLRAGLNLSVKFPQFFTEC
ncbi:hypothetical protein RchiOBHm_Chr6g0255971 [Rosa chinensis]|uniref:Uncharacterized protein n=1 Tax=Rosa chinensis TaxID=74649 RepID=A0A2P6PM11_ROSCH|nr:hypothetical protein RchiOBHm_Chr6g0255971 [Rosa chinensis]